MEGLRRVSMIQIKSVSEAADIQPKEGSIAFQLYKVLKEIKVEGLLITFSCTAILFFNNPKLRY
jgi:hypothetical protein